MGGPKRQTSTNTIRTPDFATAGHAWHKHAIRFTRYLISRRQTRPATKLWKG